MRPNTNIRVRPDTKGRVTLGKIAEGVSSYTVIVDKNKRVILEPFVEVPAHEEWLLHNKTALKQIQQGLKDSATGRVTSKGSFVKYAEED